MESEKKPSFFKKHSQGYTFKVLTIIALVLLLLIPLNMIKGLVNERGRTAVGAESDIMEAWGNQLIAGGPVIAIPGVETEEVRVKTENGGERTELQRKDFTLVINPKNLNITADFKTEVRKRGIFSVPLFSGTLNLSGTFDSPERAISALSNNQRLSLGQAKLIISLSDQKGILKINKSLWNDGELFFQPGNQENSLFMVKQSEWGESSRVSTGIYATLPRIENNEASFNVNIEIRGGRSVKVLPMGQDTHVSISSDWDSPSFQGAFLPGESTITDKDFTASWDISYLSRDIPLFYAYYSSSKVYTDSLFGVNFFRTIDTYALNTRAVKYAILFLIVPFLTLFLLEIFTKKRIHPVPYLLSGIGNAVFYLLLLSLSEQMPFYTAYLIAALAVTALLTLYSRSLLPSWNKSWYMGLVVAISYILLYAVLNAESYALLIGSIGTFVMVALIMFLTRKLDWYGDE